MPQAGIYKRTAEIGFWLNEKHWGKGIIPAAVQQLIQYLADRYSGQFTRLTAKVYACNSASQQALKKCGFVHEATLHHMVLDRLGHIQDETIFAFFF